MGGREGDGAWATRVMRVVSPIDPWRPGPSEGCEALGEGTIAGRIGVKAGGARHVVPRSGWWAGAFAEADEGGAERL